MIRDTLLIVLTAAGAALCWLFTAVEPSVDLSRWIVLVVALMTGLATTLSKGLWLGFVIASAVGVFAGLLSGWLFFPSNDTIANTYAPYVVALGTLISLLVSLVTALVSRRLSVFNKPFRLAAWFAFLCCVAFGPVALA